MSRREPCSSGTSSLKRGDRGALQIPGCTLTPGRADEKDILSQREEIDVKEILDAQRQHWQKTFVQKPDMFGAEPSEPARIAAEMFEKEGKEGDFQP